VASTYGNLHSGKPVSVEHEGLDGTSLGTAAARL